MPTTYPNKQKGQAVMLSLLLFLGVSMSVIFALAGPVIAHLHIMREAHDSKQTYYLAEGLTEDILYRLNHAMEVLSTESLQMGNYTATAIVTNGVGNKEIEVVAQKSGINRKVKTRVTTGTGLSFNYGIQTGTGGLIMENNASVVGNVYSNGNITGGSVTETAIAANSSATASDQSNDTPMPPTQSIIFRSTASDQDFAQSFRVSTSSYTNKIQLYIKKVGSPSNAIVRIVQDSSGSPGITNLFTTQGTLSSNLVSTGYGWVEVVFPQAVLLSPNTTYWVVIDSSSHSSSNYYEIAANTAYTNGTAKVGMYSSTWSATTPSGLDAYFNLYMGGSYSSITNVTIGKDAWAHTVTGGSVGGTKYCQIGTGCNTSRSHPSPQGFPISDSNINDWKAEAEAGGTISTFNATSSSKIGPVKINGNLTIANGSVTYLNGVIWVTGNIIVDNGAMVRLPASFGSSGGVIVTDGRILIRNNSQFAGSGQPGSFILAVSTSDCPESPSCSGNYAIELANNGGAVILNAQKGTLHLNNNAGAKEATAKTIRMDNGAVIQYETGLFNINFSSGPSGSWRVDGWQEIE